MVCKAQKRRLGPEDTSRSGRPSEFDEEHLKALLKEDGHQTTRIVRTEKFEALKRGLKSQQSLFTKVKTEQEAATRASFRVALEIAKR
ncbi:hypothetical protein LAZ67_9002278 [Cordylochernes scorpioides]|uniref:Uncharacterized protein n=1 Tax=Cordylochernes scorpioides TaxID=51811 RepID=A0ABY6KTP8_9ARAC|nr:hypothetical protein LAZ67_9002278 [Cordylochernes scorpioides]